MSPELSRRLRDPRFLEFQLRRQSELIEDGLPWITAIKWASRETQGRARVSLQRGVEQALAAELVVIDQPGDAEPKFLLRGSA